MLPREHYREGLNLTDAQVEYQEQYAREGSFDVRIGRVRRPFVSLAALPDNTAASREKHGSTDFRGMTLVAADRIEFVTMMDVRARFQTSVKRIETLSLFHRLYVDGDGVPCIGGNSDHCRLKLDFARSPLMPCQASVACRQQGTLKSPVAGAGFVQRLGEHVDICVGSYQKGVQQFRQIVFRLYFSDFEDDTAELLVGQIPEQQGGEVPLGPIEEGQPLVALHKAVEFRQARMRRKEAVMDRPKGRILMATKSEYFAALNAMNKAQNDCTLSDDSPALTDPNSWAFRVLYEVPAFRMEIGDEIRQFDPVDLSSFPGFTITPALAGDLLRAVATDGELTAVAEFTGRIADVGEDSEGHRRLRYSDGRESLFPANAELSIGGKTLEAGMETNIGDDLGACVPRLHYNDLAVLSETAGGLELLLRAFLAQTCIRSGRRGWTGKSVLHNWAYIPAALLEFLPAVIDGSGVYVDFSAGEQYYLRSARGYVFPPIYTPDDETTVTVDRVHVDFSEPAFIHDEQACERSEVVAEPLAA